MPRTKERKKTSAGYYRTTLTIGPELDQKLVRFGQQCRLNGGSKLGRTAIIRALVMTLDSLDVDVQGVKTEQDLKIRVLEALKARHNPKKRTA